MFSRIFGFLRPKDGSASVTKSAIHTEPEKFPVLTPVRRNYDQLPSVVKEEPPVRDLIFTRGMESISTMQGPMPLTDEILASQFESRPGHYALGDSTMEGEMIVKVIGRADANLADELSRWVGKHAHFMAAIDRDAREAFLAECRLYHLYGRQIGKPHPMRNMSQGWSCPNCGIFNPGP